MARKRNYKNEWLSGCFGSGPAADPIDVKFSGRADDVRYTKQIFGLLKTDPSVEHITDGLTGEILFERE